MPKFKLPNSKSLFIRSLIVTSINYRFLIWFKGEEVDKIMYSTLKFFYKMFTEILVNKKVDKKKQTKHHSYKLYSIWENRLKIRMSGRKISCVVL